MSKERIAYIDILKGITICLVVIGHVIQYFLCSNDYLNDTTFRYIYGFHLQLFILLSGLTVSNKISSFKEFQSVVKKRFIQLLVPFLSWTLLSAVFYKSLVSFFTLLLYPGSGFWFLWDLFFISVLYYLALLIKTQFNCNAIVPLLIVFLLLCVITTIIKRLGGAEIFDIHRITRLFPFFVLGTIMRNVSVESFLRNRFSFVVLLVSYSVLAFFWYPNGLPSCYEMHPILESLINSPIYRLVVSITGCCFMLSLGMIFESVLKKSFFLDIGKKTLGIYVIHLFLINHLFIPFFDGVDISYNLLSLTLTTLVLVCSALLVIFLLGKNKWTSIAFLGIINNN